MGDETERLRNGLDNILQAMNDAPGLPIECLSVEDQTRWTQTIHAILMALGPYEITGKPITIHEYLCGERHG